MSNFMVLPTILFYTFLITLCVWVAVLFIFFKKESLDRIVVHLVSLSAGALMGGAFLHLLPEAIGAADAEVIFGVFLVAFSCFFIIEKLLHWRHCHKGSCDIHNFGYMNLVGDSIHNIIDGLVIAGSFMVDFSLGLATTFAVAVHEIPQEIGDYGVLVYAGFKKRTALFVNYAIALTVVIGGIAGYFLFPYLDGFLPYLLSVGAGGFVYIAASDLLPEIRKETNLRRSLVSFSFFIAGVLLMYAIKALDH